MPLLYGEGAEKSFLRLQYHILQEDDDDDTLFAWQSERASKNQPPRLRGLFASSPAEFGHFRSCWYSKRSGTKVEPQARISRGLGAASKTTTVQIVGNSLEVTAPIESVQQSQYGESGVLALNCIMGEEYSFMGAKEWNSVGIYVEKLPNNRYARARPFDLVSIDPTATATTARMSKNSSDIKRSLARSHIPQVLINPDMRELIWKGNTSSIQYGFYLPNLDTMRKAGDFQLSSVYRSEIPRPLSCDTVTHRLTPSPQESSLLFTGPRPYAPSTTTMEFWFQSLLETVQLEIRFETRTSEEHSTQLFSPDSSIMIRALTPAPSVVSKPSTMTLADIEQDGGGIMTHRVVTESTEIRITAELGNIGYLKVWCITFDQVVARDTPKIT
jgi:hypothetical protein